MRMTPAHKLGLGAVIASVTAAASVALAGTASAEPPVNETFHEEPTEVIDDYCDVPGLTVRHEAVIDGRILIHTGQFHVMDHNVVTVVETNLATGQAVTRSATTMQRALRSTDNGDGTSTVLLLETGNLVTYGPDGTAIARNPGQVRFEVLVDNNDTPQNPLDDEILDFLGFVKDSTGRTDDFCAAVLPVIT